MKMKVRSGKECFKPFLTEKCRSMHQNILSEDVIYINITKVWGTSNGMADQREQGKLWTHRVEFPNTFPVFASTIEMLDLLNWKFFLSFKTSLAWGFVASQDKNEYQTLGFFFQNRILVFQPPLPKWVKLVMLSFICTSFLISYHIILLDNICSWADPCSSQLLVNCVFKWLNISTNSCLSQM